MRIHPSPISHREEPAILLMRPWRVGHSTGRAIYCWPGGDDDVIGLMDTRTLAWAVATTHNLAITGREDYDGACVMLGLAVQGAR